MYHPDLVVKPMEIFGHNQLNLFFVPLLKVHDDGFIFKNKNYCWHDVKDVLIWEPFPDFGGVFGTAAAPRATIILAD